MKSVLNNYQPRFDKYLYDNTTCALLGDSRVRYMYRYVKECGVNIVDCLPYGGATISEVTGRTLEYLHKNPAVNSVCLSVGICNITCLTSNRKVAMRQSSLDIPTTVDRLINEYKLSLGRIKRLYPGMQVVYTTIYGVDLTRKWSGFGYHRHQWILDEIIHRLNLKIVKLNCELAVICPRSDHYIHMWDSQLKRVCHQYRRLRDGTHRTCELM